MMAKAVSPVVSTRIVGLTGIILIFLLLIDLAQCAAHYATLLRRMDRTKEAERWENRVKMIREAAAAEAARARADQPNPRFQGFK